MFSFSSDTVGDGVYCAMGFEPVAFSTFVVLIMFSPLISGSVIPCGITYVSITPERIESIPATTIKIVRMPLPIYFNSEVFGSPCFDFVI